MKMNLKDVYEELTTKDFYGKVTAQTLKAENNYPHPFHFFATRSDCLFPGASKIRSNDRR